MRNIINCKSGTFKVHMEHRLLVCENSYYIDRFRICLKFIMLNNLRYTDDTKKKKQPVRHYVVAWHAD